MKRLVVCWLAVATGALVVALPPNEEQAAEPSRPAAGGDHAGRKSEIARFFAGPVERLEVVLDKEEFQHLREEPRRYAEGEVREGQAAFAHVAVKLKGSEGSFNPVDDKPGLTLNFDKFKGAKRFHGQKKFHLNNGREDPSFLREWLGGEIGRLAGVPAGRCSHALVTINGKDKGLYVLREGFTKDFLLDRFGDDTGALFEGHFCKDVDGELELDSGDETARERLKELVAACAEAKPAARWARLGQVLDVEAYAAYLAFETELDFGDGYDFNLNNYRLYLTKGKFHFVLHGMDELVHNTDASLQRESRGRIGQAFLSCPEGRALYRKKAGELYAKVLRARDWPAAVAARADLVKAALTAAGSHHVKEFSEQAAALKEAVARRIESVGRQLKEWPEPLAFDAKGVASLPDGWHEENESGDAAELREGNSDRGPVFHVTAKQESVASWRRRVVLDRGKYHFEALARVKGVEPADDDTGRGAGVRISGSKRGRHPALEGDTAWVPIAYEFDVEDEREVVLVAELRARKGEVWFVKESLRLVRLP